MREKSKKKEWAPPSEEFVDTVTGGGGIVADCDFCGRTLFEDFERAGDWEEGELEGLREKAEKEPDKYVGFDHQVRTGYIDGKQVVTNCPCHGLTQYESFIWQHRQIISEYITKKAQKIASAAYKDEAEAEFLKENIEQEDMNREFAKCKDCGGYFDKNSLDDREFCIRCTDMHPPEDGDGESAFDRPADDDDENLPF